MDKQKEAVEAGAFLSTKSIEDTRSAFTASLLASRYPGHVTLIRLPERARQKSLETQLPPTLFLQHHSNNNKPQQQNHNDRLGYQYLTYFPRISYSNIPVYLGICAIIPPAGAPH